MKKKVLVTSIFVLILSIIVFLNLKENNFLQFNPSLSNIEPVRIIKKECKVDNLNKNSVFIKEKNTKPVKKPETKSDVPTVKDKVIIFENMKFQYIGDMVLKDKVAVFKYNTDNQKKYKGS